MNNNSNLIDSSLYHTLTKDEATLEAAKLFAIQDYNQKYNKAAFMYPTHGNLRRSLYPKHLIHFAAGQDYRQRLLMAGNRIGKTTAAAYELYCHLTGRYPEWWQGKKFTQANTWWVCGKKSQTVQQILQPMLLGGGLDFGSGMIPREYLDIATMTEATRVTTKIDAFRVHHVNGGWSLVEFKSYEQGRGAFEGTERSIWLDEEPPQDVYLECLLRTMTGDNILVMTFTPSDGMTEVIDKFTCGGNYSEGKKAPGRWLTMIGWDDLPPHLDEATKVEILASIPEYQRDARTKGIPSLGSGAVYPVHEDLLVIPPFEIPKHFRRAYAIDFGWDDPTAILWGAIDPETNIIYFYAEHYLSRHPPAIHASVIKQRNTAADMTIPGVADPSGGGKGTHDGLRTRQLYETDYQLSWINADNSIEPGISTVVDLMIAGKIKVFSTCINFISEFRSYRRQNGKLAGNDHLMDCLRYWVMTARTLAKSKTQWDVDSTMPEYEHNIFQSADMWLYR